MLGIFAYMFDHIALAFSRMTDEFSLSAIDSRPFGRQADAGSRGPRGAGPLTGGLHDRIRA